MNRTIQSIAKAKGYDRLIFKRKINAYCLQNGLPMPTDTSINNWWNGDSLPSSVWVVAVPAVLEVEISEVYGGAKAPEERNEQ